MTTKLRGSRLEAEVDRARTDGNWKRLAELMHAMKAKHSGMENMVELIEAELQLETYLELQGEILRPRLENAEALRSAESLLNHTLSSSASNNPGPTLEAHLLLAKLHYAGTHFSEALREISSSGMELANTPFRTLRALRLVAEAYAIKGLCLESMNSVERTSDGQRALFCFEKAAELAISYVGELEKNISIVSGKGWCFFMRHFIFADLKFAPGSAPTLIHIGGGSMQKPTEKMGDLLECCLERVAVLRVRETTIERKSNVEGIEWYRRIITCLGDKSTGERLQQRMSRQLAELLLRAVPSDSRGGTASQAVSMKSQNLSFYTGSQKAYFSPSSRTEEIVLLLLISEILSTREVILNRSDDVSLARHQSIGNAKSVYNLLTLVSTRNKIFIYLVSNFIYLRQQFALSLLCRGRWLRVARVLDQCIAVDDETDTVYEHMLAAQLYIEHIGQYDIALEHARKATALCAGGVCSYLKARCQLLLAIAHGQRAQCEPGWEQQRRHLSKTVELFEECVHADPHDYLTHYYCALYHAIVRDMEAARDRCARSLELNAEQPSAIMLLALIFTADGDLKSALELVLNALNDFPTHYGLLVLRLHIETKFGRIDESLDTCSHLLDFWRRREYNTEDERVQLSISAADGQSVLRDNSQKAGTPSVGRELPPSTTPIFAGPLGIGLGPPVLNSNTGSQSGMDMSMSMVDSGIPASEVGGQSTSSDSGCGTGISTAAWTRFRAQVDLFNEIIIIITNFKKCSLTSLSFLRHFNIRELVRVDPLCCQWWQELGCCLMRRNLCEKARDCFTAAAQLDRSTPLLPFEAISIVFPSSF
uniref:TPR_REGION domain-containing protein n=1 Tax=Heterorhabditis bacteriophora TaxID=37862 RepID=A0A1I7XTT5_HETBA